VAQGVGVGVEQHFFPEHFYYGVGIVSQYLLIQSVVSPAAATGKKDLKN